MRTLSRIGLPVAGIAIVAAGLVAAAPQASASTYTYAPSDCSVVTGPPYETVQMTCTARPGTQQWQLFANCTYGSIINQPDVDVYGNVVTGDGTSSLKCPPSTFEVLAYFEVVS
jgi:hypothetical protein